MELIFQILCTLSLPVLIWLLFYYGHIAIKNTIKELKNPTPPKVHPHFIEYKKLKKSLRYEIFNLHDANYKGAKDGHKIKAQYNEIRKEYEAYDLDICDVIGVIPYKITKYEDFENKLIFVRSVRYDPYDIFIECIIETKYPNPWNELNN
jgi:hypothetical protein